ncbi:hypothetical protein Ljor_1035 [Legionella jordanis]|uniref:Uncharacterized protein n=1 Tax=Legionella jordanis TaxID=456 RepID=A0A0W0VAS8_9GAMM|nr:hypothetical protein Ljor_1035 [Legionella jordanis]VEH11802.1 Uncharacterised protein [Legionella jordanis]
MNKGWYWFSTWNEHKYLPRKIVLQNAHIASYTAPFTLFRNHLKYSRAEVSS